MKKTLLSLMAVAACAFGLAAEEVTFDFAANSYGMTPVDSNTKDDPATADVNEEYPDAGKSFTFEGVTITLGEKARYWTAAANTFRVNNGQQFTLSVEGTITSVKFEGSNTAYFSTAEGTYENSTWTGSASEIVFENKGANGKTGTVQVKKMIVTYEGGTVDQRAEAGLKFAEASVVAILGDPFTAPEFTKATTAAVTFASTKEDVATVDAGTGAVTLVGPGTTTISANAEANADYRAGSASYVLKVIAVETYVKATEVTDGESYLIVYETSVATPLTSNYGYLKVSEGIAADGKLRAEESCAFTFKAVAGTENYNIMADDYYYYMTGNYNSFNRSTEEQAEGAEWTISVDAAGLVTITNTYNDKTLYYDSEYKSYGAYAEKTDTRMLPTLYKKDDASGIQAVEADASAPVEYYNLQGIRVSEPTNGLYIRRQGNKATKVLVR